MMLFFLYTHLMFLAYLESQRRRCWEDIPLACVHIFILSGLNLLTKKQTLSYGYLFLSFK